jgi:hypothetical protein
MEGNDLGMIKRVGGVNKSWAIDSSKFCILRVGDVRDRDLCSNCRSGRSLREKNGRKYRRLTFGLFRRLGVCKRFLRVVCVLLGILSSDGSRAGREKLENRENIKVREKS